MGKKNIPLIIGIAIPIAMIIFIAASIYLPNLFVQAAKFDFLYITGCDQYSKQLYSVDNGKLVKNEVEYPERYTPRAKVELYYHDITKNESRKISFSEAQKLNLDANIKSPDGFEIVYGREYNDFFPFFFFSYSDYNTRYIKNKGLSKKLNLQLQENRYYCYPNFYFIGWVIK